MEHYGQLGRILGVDDKMIRETMESAVEMARGAPRNQLLMALYRAQPGALSTHVREMSLAREDVVLEEGAVPHSVIFPEGALLSSVTTMADGRMVEVAALGHGDAAGVLSCLASAPETCRTVVRIGGPAKVIPAPVLKAAADANDALRRVLMQSIRMAAVRAEHELACTSLHDVTARLAKWLLLTCARTGESRLPVTQDDMSVILGVQRTTLNASALCLKTAGGIRYSRGVVQVLDTPRLEALACECYRQAVEDFQPDDLSGPRKVA